MTPAARDELTALRADGPRRFAGWDAAAFDAAAAGPARELAATLADEPDAAAAVVSYLRLLHQAAGTGVLTAGGRGSLLERLLLDVAPQRLKEVPAGRRAAALAEAWNVGEGLSREPAWVGRFAAAACAGLDRLDGVAAAVAHALAPVLRPPPPAAWRGGLRAAVLDLRKVHDPFLPGRVRVAAPAVVCVDDRRGGPSVGVLLRRGGCEPLGVLPGLGDHPEPGPLPAVSFADGRAAVGDRAVDVPGLRRCRAFAVAAAGFVVACADDSQRVWVIESD